MYTQVVQQGDETVFNNVQEVGGVVEQCKALSELPQSGEMKLAARMPFVVVESYMNRKGITFEEFSSNTEHHRAILNDPDLKAFRVWPGAV